MAKRYRRKPASLPPKQAKRKPFPKKKALWLLLPLVGFFAVYQIALALFWNGILHVYCIAAGLLAVAYAIWNRGVFRIPDREELPEDWTPEDKTAFLAEQTERKRRSEILLYFLIPLIATVMFDMFYLFLTLTMGYDL